MAWYQFDASRLDAKGKCVVCEGPTEAPWCSERSVCDQCCNVTDPPHQFKSPLDNWVPNGPRGDHRINGLVTPGNQFSKC